MSSVSFSPLKKALFGCVVAAIVTVLALLAGEAILRLCGYGHAPGFTRLEKDKNGNRWIRENWWVTAPFFAPELMRRPQPFRLSEKKAPKTFRVFVLGSSAAMGDPEPSFSIARMLETLLRDAYPEINFEVVNAGVTAINSHVVRGIADDCATLQPDLFVVYEGNNEVIGPFGPGTVFTPVLATPAAVRAAVFLRGLRTGQALTALARGAKPPKTGDDWGGMQMFLQHQIAMNDPRLSATVALFEDNLRAIVRAGNRAGALVVLGTVLTNQRDFAPFQSRHRAGLSAQQEAAWSSAFEAGSAAATTGDLLAAESQLKAALAIDDEYAEAHFRLARILWREGKREESKPEFQRALDLDVLRFRTDSRLNEAIRRVAASCGPRVVLGDFVKAGTAESNGGVLGDEMLYEHVHLSFRGTYVIARELFGLATAELKRRGTVSDQKVVQPLSMDEARLRLAFTTYEQAMIGKEMISRLKRPPFVAQSTNAERLGAFEQRDTRATQLLSRPESAEAIFGIYEQAISHNPSDWELHRNYGMALTAMRRGEQGKSELLKALEVIPDDPDTLYSLILAHRLLNETPEAGKRLEQLRRLAPKYPGLNTLQ